LHVIAHDVTELVAAAVVIVAFLAGLRLLAGQAFGRRGPRLRVRGGRRGGGLLMLPWLAVSGLFRLGWAVVAKVARGPAPPAEGATWWRSANSIARRPSRDPLAGKPGIVRVLAYLVMPIALAAGFLVDRVVTVAAAGVLVLLAAATWASQAERRRQRERAAAAFLAMAAYLDIAAPEVEDWRDWLAVPRSVRDDQAVITVRLPRHWAGTDRQREGITSIVNQRFPGSWEARYQPASLAATFTRPPQPPALLPFADDGGPVSRFPMGTTMRGAVRHIDFEQETPNVLISASPGWGKTLFIALVVAWFVSRGARAILLDGKRTSYTKGPRSLPMAERGFTGVSGIDLRVDLPAMMSALTEAREEMDRRYQLRTQGVDIDDETEYPTILLAIDEISRFTSDVRMWWQTQKGKGQPPCFADYLAILWQGREARIFVIVGVHNPNARVLVSGDARSMFATRIAAGPQDAGAWRMLFGTRPVPRFSSRKGRAWVAMGVDADEHQLYYADLQTARELALSRAGRPGGPRPHVPDVPPPGQLPPPGPTGPDVLDSGTTPAADRPGRLTWPPSPSAPQVWPLPTPAARPAPVPPPPGPPADELIVGLDAAAECLGTTYEAFRKLRSRNGPIPGERRVGNTPVWVERQLRDWYAKLPIAGKRLPGPDDSERDRGLSKPIAA
jgi:hypothetical protein